MNIACLAGAITQRHVKKIYYVQNLFKEQSTVYETLFELRISKTQRKQEWDSGKLVGEWAEKFPQLFDELDTKTAINQAFRGLKFVDWLSAITVYQCLGYLSLVEGYEFRNHERKQTIAKNVLPSEVWELVQSPMSERNTQGPDLLCYAPDYLACLVIFGPAKT